MYACGSSSRRKNARRSLCSSFLRNYRTALSFLLRGAASPRFLFSSHFFYPSTGAIERNRNAVSFLFIVSSSNPLTLFSPCTTFACRSNGENSLFRHFVPYQGTTRNKRGIARRKIPLPNFSYTTISCAFSSLEFLWLSALSPI